MRILYKKYYVIPRRTQRAVEPVRLGDVDGNSRVRALIGRWQQRPQLQIGPALPGDGPAVRIAQLEQHVPIGVGRRGAVVQPDARYGQPATGFYRARDGYALQPEAVAGP